jgi:acetolactate synthase-1/2/3 large subunit
MPNQKYSDYFMETLANLGYKKCFYLGGGNSMHLLESASRFFECIPVVHEVTAAIASEYYNSENRKDDKAFTLVTAGPGMTNLITGIAGAWLDSRELLVVGGQAKSTNLSNGTVRQIGHQEVDGSSIARPITKISQTIDKPISSVEIKDLVAQSWLGRKGPVFLEICLDVSAKTVDTDEISESASVSILKQPIKDLVHEIPKDLLTKIMGASRPLLLLGGGVNFDLAHEFAKTAEQWKLPIACTWTGADRCNFDYPYFAGRPNTYGMRWANVFQQQSDLLIAVGTSLGYQQTGFNTEAFLPVGEIIHVDIDLNELNKENPKVRNKLQMDSSQFLRCLKSSLEEGSPDWGNWAKFLSEIKDKIPTFENCQKVEEPKVSPQEVITFVSTLSSPDDSIVAASSGGTFTATMQNFLTRGSQRLIGNKGLASMGYGLAGAIGISTARREHRTVLFEGDGGFAQNMQDLGTVRNLDLNLKIFITSNDGYASIRTSQKNYFEGHYLGCDLNTGLVLPDWNKIGTAFQIPTMALDSRNLYSSEFKEKFNSLSPVIFIILADPEQMYLPKIFSKVDVNGQMASTALHDMYPPLEKESKTLFRYIPESLQPEFT